MRTTFQSEVLKRRDRLEGLSEDESDYWLIKKDSAPCNSLI